MSKKVIIAVVVILIILLGGAGIVLMNQKKNSSEANTSNNQNQTESKSLKDLWGMNNQECTFTDSESGNSGKIYSGNGKFGGEFSSQVDGKATASHMIADSNSVYFWIDGQTQGFKTSQALVENLGEDTVMTALDVNAKVDYSCKPWVVNSNQFSIPSNVTFTDYSNLIPSPIAVPSGSSDLESNCSVCNSLSGESKTQCLAALKCN